MRTHQAHEKEGICLREDRLLLRLQKGESEALGELLSLELGPSSAVWRFRFADAEQVHADPDQRELMVWLGAGDRALAGLRLRFADGTELALPGAMSSPLENGAVCAYLGWEKAVDIHAVTRITLGDTVLWTRGD